MPQTGDEPTTPITPTPLEYQSAAPKSPRWWRAIAWVMNGIAFTLVYAVVHFVFVHVLLSTARIWASEFPKRATAMRALGLDMMLPVAWVLPPLARYQEGSLMLNAVFWGVIWYVIVSFLRRMRKTTNAVMMESESAPFRQ